MKSIVSFLTFKFIIQSLEVKSQAIIPYTNTNSGLFFKISEWQHHRKKEHNIDQVSLYLYSYYAYTTLLLTTQKN